MKLKSLLLAGCILLISGLAHAQFNATLYTFTPLTDDCAGGNPYPDGTTVNVFWDANNNGPDPTDEQPVVGEEFGECNFNDFLINGAEFLGTPGAFFTDPTFTISTVTPQPSRYWLRLCDNANGLVWISAAFTITNGLNDYDIEALGGFTCVDSTCGGCLAPTTVQGFQATDASCTQVGMTWNAYPADQDVDSLFIYQTNEATLVTRLARTATSFNYTGAPEGTFNYIIKARKICTVPADTTFSTAASDFGTRVLSPVPPADTSFSAFPHPTLCGAVIVQFRTPSSLASIDSFCVFQNGIEVGRTGPGLPSQQQRDTIFTALSGARNYTISGWSIECGHGTQTVARSVTAAQPPAQVTGLTASNGLCSVNLAWTAVAGATSYIVRRNGSQIGTPTTNSFTDNTAIPNTVFSYTVSAFISTNPTACQEGAQSASANGSRIGTPFAPTNVVASDSVFCTHVAISWTDNSTDETGFVVRRDNVTIVTTAAGVSSFNDSLATPGLHNYDVAATNACGTSAFATTNSGSKKQVPPQVTGVNATDNLADRVTVTWTNVIRETNFRILRDAVSIGTVAADVLTFDDFTGTPNVVYTYTVVAFNECGDGVVSAGNTGQRLASLNAPNNVAATDSLCDRVTVTWTDNNSAPQETGHTILRDGNPVGSVGIDVTTFSDFTAVQGVVYSYNVQAEGTGGPAISLTPNNGGRYPLPSEPTNFDIDATDCQNVVITWTIPANADSIRIFKNGSAIATVVASPSTYTDNVGNGPQSIQYWLAAVNRCGVSDTSYFVTAQVPQSPTTPTNVAASDTSCQAVWVTWDAALGDVDGYDIYRGGVLVGNTSVAVRIFEDHPGDVVTHNYTVVARSEECADSPPSDAASGRMLESVGTPVLVMGTDRCDSVAFCWSAASGDVDGYNVYEDGEFIGTTTELCFAYVPAVHADYSYTVSAYSAACGEGELSAEGIAGYLAQPVAPANFTASDDRCDVVELTWDAQPEFSGVTGYTITRGGVEIFSGSSLNDTRTYVDEDAVLGVNNYTIVANTNLDDCVNSGASADAGSVLPEAFPPTNVVASDTSCSDVHVSWTASTGTYDSYLVYRGGVQIAVVNAPSTSYTDTEISGGTTAAYTVAAFDDVCGSTSQSTADNGTRLQGPDAPLNVTASTGNCNTILVSWDTAPGDVTEYRVFRDGILAGTVAAPTTSFEDAPAAGTYSYTVRAFSVFCGETNPSSAAVGTRLPQMGQVTALAASVDSCNGILVTWVQFPGAVSYRVYRDGGPTLIAEINAPTVSYFDATVAQGEVHTYTVSAVNPCNEGALSSSVAGSRASTPGQVTGLTATTTLVSEVCLNWADVTGELSYNIYRDDILIATNGADDLEYCDITATPGVTYTYTVAAANVCGEGLLSIGAQGVAVFSLGQVTGLTATTTDCDQVCLTWTDIANETGYEVLRDNVVLASVGAGVVDYCDLTAVAGECYAYAVRGFNVGGNGPDSDEAEGCRRDIPTQVTGLAATNTNCDAVVLTWNDATDEDRYDVYRGGTLLVQNVGALTYTDNSAVAGVVYAYTVLALNACGEAPQSAAANGVRATTPPLVAGLAASIDVCGQIGLGWTDQLSELGYRVYRDGNFLTPIATLGQNATGYIDVITGTHTYHVRAFNDCGNGDLGSGTNGTGLTVPGVATGISASNNCGDVTVSWTAPTAGPIEEYFVLRNGSQVGGTQVGTTTFIDNNVPAGSYTYRVITNNQCGDGAQSAQSNSVTVIPALVQVPSFTAAASPCFCIDITWGNVANEDGYYLYCDGVIVDTLGTNVTSTNYCPADTQSCLVQVAAFNGCEIGPLATGILVTPNTYPTAVSGFAASENICDRVRLTWNAYSQPDVTRLKIRRDGVAIATLLSGNTSFEQLGLWPQSVYSIAALRVCAAGDTIESVLATDNGRTAPTPVAPSQMAASDDGCGIVTVTFTFSNVDGQDSVMVKRNGIVIARLGGSVANVQRSFVDTNPLAIAATYEVCPVSNLCGQGACGSDLGQAAPTAGTVTNVNATNDRCTSIIVSWTGTQHALSYQVRRNGTLLISLPQGQFSYTDIVLPGSVYTYTVTATNACGSGPQSAPAQGSTIPLPPVPTGVSASDGQCNQVVVTWNEIAVATAYEVWRNNAFLADVAGGIEMYTDFAVAPGTVYNYQVRGVNQCGSGNLSAATTGFSAQVISTVTNVVATTNLNDRVRITWNNVPQEMGYEILRGFPAEVIATVGIDVTSYNDFSAAPGEEYEYRVRAFNGCGTGEMSVVSFGYRVPVDPIPFGVITVTEDLYGCMSAVVADMDNDGDADVVAAGMFADKVMWYENNGSWGYIPHVVAENWDGARSVAVGDIDDDGDMDIAAVAQFADQLVWFRHNANGTYTPIVINNNYDGARDVLIIDLDRDGDKDLVTAACDANDISWWRNNGSEAFTRIVIDNNFVGARTVEVQDIGADNDWDILASAYEGGMLAWYSNNGTQTFTRNVLVSEAYGASYINAARLNNDNVLDIYFCVSQDQMIGWIDGATQEMHVVTTLVPFPREMDAVDLDQDNRADLLLAANENQEISWWRNTDNRFYRNPITTNMPQASVVHGGDFDNDGDNDVIGAGEGTIKLWLSALSDDDFASELILPQDDDETDQPTYSQSTVPLNYELSSNYPNPFNPMTQIRFGLPEAQTVKLAVYDVTGREVARLADGAFGAGYHTVTFDATNLASGLYLYRIEAGDFVSSRKMILMK